MKSESTVREVDRLIQWLWWSTAPTPKVNVPTTQPKSPKIQEYNPKTKYNSWNSFTKSWKTYVIGKDWNAYLSK